MLEKDFKLLNVEVVQIIKQYYKKEMILFNKTNNIINEELNEDDED